MSPRTSNFKANQAEYEMEDLEALPGEEVEEAPPVVPEGFVSKEDNDRQVALQHKKFRDEERWRIKEAGRVAELERKLSELEPKVDDFVIPPVPDQNSDTYAEDVVKRDKAIADKAQLVAKSRQEADQIQRGEAERVAQVEAAIGEKVKAFDTNMVTHGLNPTDTKKAADAVIEYGISDTFQDILLEDTDGPLFVQYLANNPLELEKISKMSTLQLVNHLNGDMRSKAALLKPKTSGAPAPPITLEGGGVGEMKEKWEEGVSYE